MHSLHHAANTLRSFLLQLHPLFEDLKLKVQALVPTALRDALTEDADERAKEKGLTASGGDGESGDRGLFDGKMFSEAKEWFKGATMPALDKAVDIVVDILDGPIKVRRTQIHCRSRCLPDTVHSPHFCDRQRSWLPCCDVSR